jgi:hypothetical protein
MSSNGGSYLVFDIETIPDYSVWTPPGPELPKLSEEKKPGKAALEFLSRAAEVDLAKLHPADIEKAHDIATRAEKADLVARFAPALEPEKAPFPPLYACQPITIAFLWLDRDLHCRQMGCVSAEKYGSERALLAGWADFLGRERPSIVTWGGRGFDVPVINLRSFRNGVSQRWLDKDYRYRYNEERHIDLCELLTDYGAVPKLGFKLGTFAKLCGLPGKDDMNGSHVEALYKDGKLAEIEAYCTLDAVKTAFALLRFFLVRGRVSLDEYRAAARGLLEHCRAQAALVEFAGAVDVPRLLLEQE